MTDTTAERARKYRAAQKERGLVEMRIWLPPALHEPVRDMAEWMLANHKADIALRVLSGHAEKMRKDWEDEAGNSRNGS